MFSEAKAIISRMPYTAADLGGLDTPMASRGSLVESALLACSFWQYRAHHRLRHERGLAGVLLSCERRMTPYDLTGVTYSLTRRPDPRIASVIARALRGAVSVANIRVLRVLRTLADGSGGGAESCHD